MRLLLVEDHEIQGVVTFNGLLKAGYAVDWARSGKEAFSSLAAAEYECVLLDLGLPDTTGEQVLQGIRQSELPVAVIVVSVCGGIQDRVRLLDMGADDYMTKPTNPDELHARLRAVLRRVQVKAQLTGDAQHGPLKLNSQRRTASWNGRLVPLTNKEFRLLETLVRHKNEVLSRAQLELALYSWDEEVESNAIEVYVHYLRRKFSPLLIQTVRGVGYQLAPELGIPASATALP